MWVTMDEIARIAGVSKATVSRVVNQKAEGVSDATRKRIQELLDRMGYQASPVFSAGTNAKTKTIGLIVPDITNPFFPRLVEAVEEIASLNGYLVLLGNTNFSSEKEDGYISAFIAKKVDGIILASVQSRYSNAYDLFKKYDVPYVLVDRNIRHSHYGAGVFVCNDYALFTACEYLIRHGNTDIAFISGPAMLSTSVDRIEGYRAALTQYQIPYQEDLVKYGNYTVDSGYQAIMELYEDQIRFTAVIASNDTMAIGAMNALRKLKINVPEQVEVIGFDDIEFGKMISPALTTIQQPVREMGRKAASILLSLINGKDPEHKVVNLDARLIVRESTR